AVHCDALEPVGGAAVCQMLAREREVVGRRVGVQVVVDDVNDGKATDAGQVHGLVHVAASGGAVSTPADRNPRLLAKLERERDAGDDRDHRRQVADAGQQAATGGEVVGAQVGVAAAGGTALASHELAEDGGRR